MITFQGQNKPKIQRMPTDCCMLRKQGVPVPCCPPLPADQLEISHAIPAEEIPVGIPTPEPSPLQPSTNAAQPKPNRLVQWMKNTVRWIKALVNGFWKDLKMTLTGKEIA